MVTPHTIAIIGGTGAQGRGLAVRFAAAGHRVILGSRDADRAVAAATELAHDPKAHLVVVGGDTNEIAAARADVIVIATPWDPDPAAISELERHTRGKVVISCVNPLGFDKSGPYGLDVAAGSAAEHFATLLPEAKVAGAFHHVAASRLLDLSHDVSGEDVLIGADDLEALEVTVDLARAVSGRPGIDAGGLRACRQLEPWTAVLIGIHKNYRTHSGIAVRNVDTTAARRVAATPAAAR
jgi:NADPH-dependent F420 reductase